MRWPPTKTFSSHPWQVEAIEAWERAGCHGVVEAVTGTGKTYIGLEAIDRLIRSHERLSVLVVVPTLVLLRQWRDRLMHGWSPPQRVGIIGGGSRDDYSMLPIACVAVINSAIRALPRIFEHVHRNPAIWRTLLIADECHHYIDGPEWRKLTTKWRFNYVLGLTATMPKYEADGLGKIVYEYTFERACDDGLAPAFDLINAKVEFADDERDAYLLLDRQVSDQWREVNELYGHELEHVSQESFFKKLQEIMRRGARTPDEYDPAIRRFLVLLYKRAAIAHRARHKLALAKEVAQFLVADAGRKVIVFFERIESAEEFGEEYKAAVEFYNSVVTREVSGIPCTLYHSGMTAKEREAALKRFADGGAGVLVACRALDEGLDLPDVDAAILVSSTRSQRQRIQRIGRTLRRGSGHGRRVVISIHVLGTGDDETCADDRRIFGRAAKIYYGDRQETLALLRRIVQPRITDMAQVQRTNGEQSELLQLRPLIVRPPTS